MKVGFSNLSCPQWSIEHTAKMAREMGYDGVELRLLQGNVIDPVQDAQAVVDAVATLRAQGLDVCALDSSCTFNNQERRERMHQVDSLLQWIRLAGETQVPLIRVFGGAGQEQAATEEEVDGWVAEGLSAVVPAAQQAGVTVVLETHDTFSSARRVARVLQRIDSPTIAVLWDSHHPYRVGETVEDVLEAVRGRLAHVHIKDARRIAGSSDWQLTLLGEGEVPVQEQLQALKRVGYSGYIVVEWEKKWHPEIAEPEIALPQHLAWLRERNLV